MGQADLQAHNMAELQGWEKERAITAGRQSKAALQRDVFGWLRPIVSLGAMVASGGGVNSEPLTEFKSNGKSICH